MGFFNWLTDDVLGLDPAPPPPSTKVPAPPAPERRMKTDNVNVGVDASRRILGDTAGSTRSSRTLFSTLPDAGIGVGLNV